jgi:hypothetical protein
MALCFDRYLFTAINFMRAQMTELLPTMDNNLCESLTRLLDCFLEPFQVKEGRDAPKKRRGGQSRVTTRSSVHLLVGVERGLHGAE